MTTTEERHRLESLTFHFGCHVHSASQAVLYSSSITLQVDYDCRLCTTVQVEHECNLSQSSNTQLNCDI